MESLSLQNLNILIVEDEPSNTAFLEELLTSKNAHLFYAETGYDAIETAKNNKIDLILMDIRLPDMSGYKAIKEIFKHKPGIKIIAQTAYAAPEDKQLAIEAGCIDYICKPIKKELLYELLIKYFLND